MDDKHRENDLDQRPEQSVSKKSNMISEPDENGVRYYTIDQPPAGRLSSGESQPRDEKSAFASAPESQQGSPDLE